MRERHPDESALIAALRQSDEPSRDDRERVRDRVLTRIALVGAAAAVSGTSAEAAMAGTAATVKTTAALASCKALTIVGVLLASVGGAGYWMVRSSAPGNTEALPREAPVLRGPEAAAAAMPVRERAPAATVDLARAGEGRATRAPKAAVARPGSSADRSDLDAEVSLLARAQKALGAGDAARALTLLDSHAAKHPHGILQVERAGVRAIALCTARRTAEGRAAAAAFLAKHAQSPLAARVRAACLSGGD